MKNTTPDLVNREKRWKKTSTDQKTTNMCNQKYQETGIAERELIHSHCNLVIPHNDAAEEKVEAAESRSSELRQTLLSSH
mmetsp:Transcript_52246/g.59709  ORF Transcript_52246/g.59709 Transcript_52246/m.59709 type:complete len:80 (-) Transcript_52246:81-320(-)